MVGWFGVKCLTNGLGLQKICGLEELLRGSAGLPASPLLLFYKPESVPKGSRPVEVGGDGRYLLHRPAFPGRQGPHSVTPFPGSTGRCRLTGWRAVSSRVEPGPTIHRTRKGS